jgi:hypothetical protein
MTLQLKGFFLGFAFIDLNVRGFVSAAVNVFFDACCIGICDLIKTLNVKPGIFLIFLLLRYGLTLVVHSYSQSRVIRLLVFEEWFHETVTPASLMKVARIAQKFCSGHSTR